MMTYEKPKLVIVAAAAAVIQANVKGVNEVYDMMPEETIGAYEADE
jgi:hypothetical protein